MDIKEVRSSVDLIRDASSADLVIISLFLLPILLGAWSLLLNSLHFLDQHDGSKLLTVGILLLIYVAGLVIMKLWDPREEKLKRARAHVENRLRRRPGHRASFDAIRSEVDSRYDDPFIRELIDKNPGIFQTCTIKRTDGTKAGITLVDESPETAQQIVAGEPRQLVS
jgi:hypothetical protein